MPANGRRDLIRRLKVNQEDLKHFEIPHSYVDEQKETPILTHTVYCVIQTFLSIFTHTSD